ncbi:T9SS type A sorting domain-containing protein [Phaeocystidibacter marisrubri]|uniref:T9SS type A sorting domain-containing protein n=1 Tax=Phaeocystidibacter marisrubri TaxID=1577780 RepID=A0A6L3ZHS8_9FLAO|nr:T9SS type A sorting domain-containing protein [Phaeocystidibacter marisrubri]KAB2817414.1 T9SS type A sorting domain-containing protein [Phaeocystidibacter marisrubri]GGH75469.1 hypothetical protein GCM10011318_22510 [Phaeocystidibacter marisrubri]
MSVVCFAQEQERSHALGAEVLSESPNGVISVSPQLYERIKAWLAIEEIPLDHFLASSELPQGEVQEFLNQFNVTFSKTGSDCICATIRPNIVYSYRTIDPNQWTDNHEVVDDGDWFGGAYRKTTRLMDGPGMNLDLYFYWDDGAFNTSIEIKESLIQVELLNLCTQLFYRNSECFCEKPLRVSSRAYYNYNYDSRSYGLFTSHGRAGELDFGFSTLVLDLEPNINGQNIFSELDVKSFEIYNGYWKAWINPNWKGYLKFGGELAKTIYGIATISPTGAIVKKDSTGNVGASPPPSFPVSNLSDLSNALNGLGTKYSIYTSSLPGSGNRAYSSITYLKSNIPKVILHVGQAKVYADGSGTSGHVDIDFGSTYQATHVVGFHDIGYSDEMTPISEGQCCNEDYGFWWYSEDYSKIGIANVQTDIANLLNYGGVFRWYNAYPITLTLHSSGIPAYINSSTRQISRVRENAGEVEGDETCRCKSLEYRPNERLVPRIVANSLEYCRQSFTIHDATYPNLVQLFPNVESRWRLNGVDIPGSTNSSSVTVNGPGTYSLVYVDLVSGYCQTIDAVEITQCVGKHDFGSIQVLNGSIYINTDNQMDRVDIFTLDGRLISSNHADSHILSMQNSKLAQGVYIVKVLLHNGEYIVERIVL